MCTGNDHTCPDFELHRKKLLNDLDCERRSFLKSAFLASGGAAAAWAASGTLTTPASAETRPGQPTYHYLPATADTVHWGYFSKLLKPQLEVDSGDYVTIEALTHHANDDAERMIKGDPGAESVFLWTKDKKGVNRRGAGPIDGKLLGRGAGEGFGVHICTGPVFIRGAEPGDILEVRIMDVKPRPCANPGLRGQVIRQQRGGLVGLSLQGPASPSRSRARSARSTKSTPAGSATGRRRSIISAGRRRPIRSASFTKSSTIPACRSITRPSRRTTAS